LIPCFLGGFFGFFVIPSDVLVIHRADQRVENAEFVVGDLMPVSPACDREIGDARATTAIAVLAIVSKSIECAEIHIGPAFKLSIFWRTEIIGEECGVRLFLDEISEEVVSALLL
jgi:hypothetical protein